MKAHSSKTIEQTTDEIFGCDKNRIFILGNAFNALVFEKEE